MIIVSAKLVSVCSMILKVPGNSPYTHFTEVGNNTDWIFFVKTCRDGFIGLFGNTDTGSKIYEIVFGAGRNTYTVLRKGGQGIEYNYGTHLDCGIFKSFWINWANKSITVGSGTFIGQNKLISKPDLEQGPIHYLALSTFKDQVGYWILQLSCAK
ncbi:hypothetical protein SNE40_016551 [Patella caerulea]